MPSKTASAARNGRPAPSTYVTYLRIDELLDLQKPADERLHPDELTFQVVHQTFELWWKATVEFFARAAERLAADDPAGAQPLLRRAVSAQEVNLRALRQLELVAPADFLIIRKGLGDGSGADSPGFRAILRAAPGLWDAYSAALERAGVTLLQVYQQPHEHLALYECAEALTDFDETFHLFRAMHLKLAQRNLGLRAIGTGGTPMEMLERTLRDLLFLPLWEARDELLALSGASVNEATGHSA
jgi:tryptophan 2,3-dioxygenase